jgi:hypothetical protein
MRYLLCFLCPPLAILLCGKPIQAIICIPLCVTIFPPMLWALLVVSGHKADLRNNKQMKNATRNSKAQIKAIERQTRATERAIRESQPSQTVVVQVVQVHVEPPERPQLPPQGRARPIAPDKAPIILDDLAAEPEPPVKAPRVTLEDLRNLVAQAKQGAIDGYQNLPEWAQPISWGLAAATPISLIVILLFLRG